MGSAIYPPFQPDLTQRKDRCKQPYDERTKRGSADMEESLPHDVAEQAVTAP